MKETILKNFLHKKVVLITTENLVYNTKKLEFDVDDESVFFIDKFGNYIVLALSQIKSIAENTRMETKND